MMANYLSRLLLLCMLIPLAGKTQSSKNIKTAITSVKTSLAQSHTQATNYQKSLKKQWKQAKSKDAKEDLGAQLRGNRGIIEVIDGTLKQFNMIEKDLFKDLDGVIARHKGKMAKLDKELRSLHRRIQSALKKYHKSGSNESIKRYNDLTDKHAQVSTKRDIHQGLFDTLQKIKASQTA